MLKSPKSNFGEEHLNLKCLLLRALMSSYVLFISDFSDQWLTEYYSLRASNNDWEKNTIKSCLFWSKTTIWDSSYWFILMREMGCTNKQGQRKKKVHLHHLFFLSFFPSLLVHLIFFALTCLFCLYKWNCDIFLYICFSRIKNALTQIFCPRVILLQCVAGSLLVITWHIVCGCMQQIIDYSLLITDQSQFRFESSKNDMPTGGIIAT